MCLQDPLLIPCFQEKTLYHLHKLCIKKMIKILRPLMSLFFLTKNDSTFKACARYFYKIFISHQMIALEKLRKMLFILSKKLFSFSRC